MEEEYIKRHYETLYNKLKTLETNTSIDDTEAQMEFVTWLKELLKKQQYDKE